MLAMTLDSIDEKPTGGSPLLTEAHFNLCVCVSVSPQLMEVTGKNQDECMVALHDCNEDVSRAINFLLESTSDMVGLQDL